VKPSVESPVEVPGLKVTGGLLGIDIPEGLSGLVTGGGEEAPLVWLIALVVLSVDAPRGRKVTGGLGIPPGGA